jgi:hypothetical protein
MSEEIEEIKEQFEKQLARIRALRERKETEPGLFFYSLLRVDLLNGILRRFLWSGGESA